MLEGLLMVGIVVTVLVLVDLTLGAAKERNALTAMRKATYDL